MMDSLVNNLRQNCMIIAVKLQTVVCVAINLLLTAIVTLLTALLVRVMVVIPAPLWVVSHPHKGK